MSSGILTKHNNALQASICPFLGVWVSNIESRNTRGGTSEELGHDIGGMPLDGSLDAIFVGMGEIR